MWKLGRTQIPTPRYEGMLSRVLLESKQAFSDLSERIMLFLWDGLACGRGLHYYSLWPFHRCHGSCDEHTSPDDHPLSKSISKKLSAKYMFKRWGFVFSVQTPFDKSGTLRLMVFVGPLLNGHSALGL